MLESLFFSAACFVWIFPITILKLTVTNQGVDSYEITIMDMVCADLHSVQHVETSYKLPLNISTATVNDAISAHGRMGTLSLLCIAGTCNHKTGNVITDSK